MAELMGHKERNPGGVRRPSGDDDDWRSCNIDGHGVHCSIAWRRSRKVDDRNAVRPGEVKQSLQRDEFERREHLENPRSRLLPSWGQLCELLSEQAGYISRNAYRHGARDNEVACVDALSLLNP